MEKNLTHKKFIRLGAAIGVTTAGASVVAACGGGDTGSSGGTTSAGFSGSGSGSTASGISSETIAQTSEVPRNSAQQFTNDGQPAVLIHLESGDFAAYSAICTHQQCEVAYQQDSGDLACPCHGPPFDPSNGGEVLQGPADQPLPEIPVQVQNGQVVRA